MVFSVSTLSFAATNTQLTNKNSQDDSPPNIGNFSLPDSQQPGPLMSFGQTIIGKNHMQTEISTYNVTPANGGGKNLNTTLLYGLTDNTAFYLNVPIQSDYGSRANFRLGLQDQTVQLENAFYSNENSQYEEVATIVAAITVPTQVTASKKGLPKPVSFGSATYFGGITYNRTYVNWLGFISPGFLLTTTSDHFRIGSQYFYQSGVGRNIFSVTDRYVVLGLLELNGQYTEKDRILGRSLPNTGGNVVTLTPSLWISTKKLIIQAGLSLPIVQNLNGTQSPMHYAFVGEFVWTIA